MEQYLQLTSPICFMVLWKHVIGSLAVLAMGARDREFYSEMVRENIDEIAKFQPGSEEEFIRDEWACAAILKRLFLVAEGLSALDGDPVARNRQLGSARRRIIALRRSIAFGNVDKAVVWELISDGSLEQLRNGLG